MPKELLMMQNSFAWTDAEGRLITADKALRCNARNLLVEGKTFNNVYKMENLKFTSIGTGGSQELKSDGYFYLNKIASDKYCDIVQDLTLLIKPNTIYTLVVDIRTNTLTTSMGFNVEYMNRSWFLENPPLPAGTTGRKIYKLTSKSDFLTDAGARPIRTQLSPSAEGIIEYKVILLEGDYTNSYIPSNVDGIESVAEREKEGDLYPVQITQSHNETAGIVLPNGVKNTIENGVHIQRVGKIIINGSENITLDKNSTNTIIYGIQVENCIVQSTNIKTQYPLCDKYTGIAQGSLWSNDIEGCSYSSNSGGIIRISILKSKLSNETVTAFINYISQNPITVYYELATPITESLITTEIPLPQPLRSLPNGVCDEVVGNKLIQRVGKMIVDGTNNISISEVRENTIRFFVTDSTIKNVPESSLPFLSDSLLKTNSCWSKDIEGIYQGNSSNKFVVSISKNKLGGTTVNDIKAYFAENPMTLYYELATPIEHTINVPLITISKGGNIITTTNNIKPNLSIKYKQSKKIIKYLYNLGDTCNRITGGYDAEDYFKYGGNAHPIFNNDNIYIKTDNTNRSCILQTNNSFNLSNYRKLCADMEVINPMYINGPSESSQDWSWLVIGTYSHKIDTDIMDSFTLKQFKLNETKTRQVLKFDISDVNNSGHIAIWSTSSLQATRITDIKIYKIWLEK